MLVKVGRLFREVLALFQRLRDNPLGVRAALERAFLFEWHRQLSKCGMSGKGRLIKLHLRECRHPLYARYQTTDRKVLDQIFIRREYACLPAGGWPRLIVDCGANVGYASLYYLNAYPGAKVVAIEPEPSNFAVCQKNLAPYEERVQLRRAAVWSGRGGLRLVRGRYRDGGEWATQVEACPDERSAGVQAVTLQEILEESGAAAIDILKMDIESAEKRVFADGGKGWLDRTRNIVIELHDEECEAAFFRALEPYEYALSRSGELTVVQGLSPRRDRPNG